MEFIDKLNNAFEHTYGLKAIKKSDYELEFEDSGQKYAVKVCKLNEIEADYISNLVRFIKLGQHKNLPEVLDNSIVEEAWIVLTSVQKDKLAALRALAKTNKIGAIKAFRIEYGCSLLLAKCIIEFEE